MASSSKLLLDELLRQHLLSESLISEVLKDAEYSKKTVEDIIHERQLLKDVALAEVKSKALGIPYKKIDVSAIPAELFKLIPEETALSYKVVPIQKTQNLLVAGMLYPEDEKAQEVLRFVARREKHNLGIYLISRDDFDLVLRR